ncbi:MAG: O-antigen ligase family protein [Bacilli bacterium]|nr:O-antigen ligase family protein [Bacilli bacterium]
MKEKTQFWNSILNKITDIYIFMIIVLFPLLVDKTGFLRIFEYKYKCFLCISSIYLISSTLIIIYNLIRKRNIFKNKKVGKMQILALMFLLLNIISYFMSPYLKVHDLFIGVGRKEGLLTSSLYILSFLYVSYFGEFKKKYILYFSISSILINVVAILQFVGFNPFNMYQNGIGTHNVSFMATIGNIDFISAIYTILLTVSFTSYIFLKNNKYEKIIHLLSVFFGGFIFQIIDVSSGKLAFGVILILILPFIFATNERLSNFLKLIGMVLLSTAINIFMNIEYHYDIGKLGFYFKVDYILILLLIIVIILLILSRYLKNLKYDVSKNKKIIKYYYLLLGIGLIFGVILLYFIPFKSGFLYEIHELLHFNFDDDFGTYRIFLWKRTLPLIKDYPLFGSGPDTFVLRFMPLYSEDIASIGPFSINDTAANIYLTMLINLGFSGTICYIVFLVYGVYIGIRKINKYIFVLLSAVICYMVQSFFNLSVVIVSPIFWVLLGVYYLCIYDKKKE